MTSLFTWLVGKVWQMLLFGDEVGEDSARLAGRICRTDRRALNNSLTEYLRAQRSRQSVH